MASSLHQTSNSIENEQNPKNFEKKREKLKLSMPNCNKATSSVDILSPTKKLKQFIWNNKNEKSTEKIDADIEKNKYLKGIRNKKQFTRYSEDSQFDVPSISVPDNRRISISSQLRFSRTFSTDSIDSLEKLCLKEFRRQRILMIDDTNKPTTTALLSPTNVDYPSLKNVGRSKTEPVTDEASKSNSIKQPISSLSFDATKLNVVDSSYLRQNSNFNIYNDILKSRTLKDLIGLSSYQAKLLLQCWPNIYSTGTSGTFASQVYPDLCKRNFKAKTILQKADGVYVFKAVDTDCTSLHIKVTLELIDTIIKTLDTNPSNVITYLTEIGQSHKALKDEGLNIAMWDDFGDSVLDGVRKNDLVRRHKELRRAWLAIIAFITDNIKQGYSSFRTSPSTNEIIDQKTQE